MERKTLIQAIIVVLVLTSLLLIVKRFYKVSLILLATAIDVADRLL